MRAIQSAATITCALVHPSAQQSVSRLAAHRTFIIEKLGLSATVLAGMPFFLVYRGVPTLVEAIVFGLALMQLTAAMIVARTGCLALGHYVAAGSFTGIAATFALGVSGGLIACFAWLIVAGMEAVSSFDRRLNQIVDAAIVAVAGLALTVGTTSTTPATGSICMACVAIVAILVIAHRIVAVRAVEQANTTRDAARGEAVAAALGGAVITFDGDGLVEHGTSDCNAVLGIGYGDLVGRGLFEHVHVADRPAFLKLLADTVHDSGLRVAQVRLRSGTPHVNDAGQQEPRHIRVEMRAHRVETGNPESCGRRTDGIVAVLSDITDKRQQSVEAEDAQPSLEPATRSRDEFLANMSHELRTPLNAIIGFSEMLASQTIRPVEESKQREYARIIHQSGQHLLSVVNSILDMSKIQSGTFALIPEPFAVAQLVDQCCDMMRLSAQTAGVDVIRDMPDSIADVLGDRRACKQILINLMSNAIKFTPAAGRVTVRLRPEGSTLCITVADTGIGISSADLSRLGDPFFQVRSSVSRAHEGTGLGLSLVGRLIDLHGGSLAIASDLGKGTTVTVRLPFDRRIASRDGAGSGEVVGLPVADRRRKSDATSFLEAERLPQARMKQIA